MAETGLTLLSNLALEFVDKQLILSVDQVSIRETVLSDGDPPFSFKELQSVDIHCWDEVVRCCFFVIVCYTFLLDIFLLY